MKKIVRLTENDLVKLVKRVINEQTSISNAPSNPNQFFSLFPCLNKSGVTIQGGKGYHKGSILMPELADEKMMDVQLLRSNGFRGSIGKLSKGGFYYCSTIGDGLVLKGN